MQRKLERGQVAGFGYKEKARVYRPKISLQILLKDGRA